MVSKYGIEIHPAFAPTMRRIERQHFLTERKASVEAYFARQMGMTVLQWREAQAGTLEARGAKGLARDRTRRWFRAGKPAPPMPDNWDGYTMPWNR